MSFFDLKLSRFQLQVLAIFYRTLKSAAFNVAVFVAGFGVGLAVIAMNVHQQAKRNSTWELLS